MCVLNTHLSAATSAQTLWLFQELAALAAHLAQNAHRLRRNREPRGRGVHAWQYLCDNVGGARVRLVHLQIQEAPQAQRDVRQHPAHTERKREDISRSVENTTAPPYTHSQVTKRSQWPNKNHAYKYTPLNTYLW